MIHSSDDFRLWTMVARFAFSAVPDGDLSIPNASAMIAAGPGNPADFTFYEEFLSWKRPLFL
jgi:hypothetical protein